MDKIWSEETENTFIVTTWSLQTLVANKAGAATFAFSNKVGKSDRIEQLITAYTFIQDKKNSKMEAN